MAKQRRHSLGIDFPKPKFGSAQVVMTKGAQNAFTLEDSPEDYLARHFFGDYGDLSDADKVENNESLKNQGMVMSSYTTDNGTKIWIITDPGHEVTTILLPDEY